MPANAGIYLLNFILAKAGIYLLCFICSFSLDAKRTKKLSPSEEVSA